MAEDRPVQYARSANIEDLKAVIRALNDNGVDYLLIGGYALYAHGYYRATVDIDILVPATAEQGEKVRRALLVLPQGVSAEMDPEWFREGDAIRVADEFVVDVMFNACGETYEMLVPYCEVVDLDGIPVRTVSLEGLLRTKRGVREKDVADRVVLERAIDELSRRPPTP
jgi:predicted nucleotidyltransferase